MRILLCVLLLAVSNPSLQEVETKIQEFELQKKQLEKSVDKRLEKAMRQQFSQEFYLESRREYELVVEEEEKIHLLEKKIHKLQKRKKELLSNESFCVK